MTRHVELVAALQVDPKLRGGAEVAGQSQGRVCCAAAPAAFLPALARVGGGRANEE